MLDFDYNLNAQAVVFAHYLQMYLGKNVHDGGRILPGLKERITFPELVERERLSVRTAVIYNGRERGPALVVTNVSMDRPALVIWWAECRSSEALFVQVERPRSSDTFLSAIEVTQEGYEARSYFNYGCFEKAADHIAFLLAANCVPEKEEAKP